MDSAKPRIVADQAIPYLQGLLEPYAQVTYLPATQITHEVCLQADALLTRTRTRCNAQLLDHTPVECIASATVGLDHIDLPYCKNANIHVGNAPGCSAWAVVQWVWGVLYHIQRFGKLPLLAATVGIIGYGQIGQRLAALLQLFGIRWLANDPPLAAHHPELKLVDLDTIARECQIITIHAPLTKCGPHPTEHLLDHSFIRKLGHNRPYILHAARGGIVDDVALRRALHYKDIAGYALDVYENEPDVSSDLLENSLFATPHIAGYSIEGKRSGTQLALNTITEHFHLPNIALPPMQEDTDSRPHIAGYELSDMALGYDLNYDSQALIAAPQDFERLRTNYHYRHDYRGYSIGNPKLKALIDAFRPRTA